MAHPAPKPQAPVLSPTAAVVAQDLAARRGAALLWRNLSFSLPPGLALVVRGRNGSGKTTLLRMLAGLAAPAAGTLAWRGRPLVPFAQAIRDDVVYVGHAAALSDELTARQNLAALADLAGDAPPAAAQAAALADVAMGECADVAARALSAGQRRRVHLARLALTTRPLWVLDEPTTSLDDAAIDWLGATLARQLARGGTVVAAAHGALPLPAALCRDLAL